MTIYRATRTENRVGVGDFTRDFHAGELIEPGVNKGAGQVPQNICDYLVSHGILVDARVNTEPAQSPAPSPDMPAPHENTPATNDAVYAQLSGGDATPRPPSDQPGGATLPKAGDPQADGLPAKPGDEGDGTPDSSHAGEQPVDDTSPAPGPAL